MIHIIPFTIREFVLIGFVVVLLLLLLFAIHRVQKVTRELRQLRGNSRQSTIQCRKIGQP